MAQQQYVESSLDVHPCGFTDGHFFSPAIFDISCVPTRGRGVSDACTYDVTWKTPQLSGCEKEPPVIYCAWSLPCRSASADTYGRSPFHLLLADCRGLLPRGRGGLGGPRCTVVVANSWVGRGAAGLHGGGSAGARAGSFQWQHRGAGDRLIKMFADGLGYGTHVCAWPHDAHPSQLTARERDADLAQERSAGWAAHGGQQGEEGPRAACWALGLPGTLQSGHQLGVCPLSPLQKWDDLRLQTKPWVLLKSSAHRVQPCSGNAAWEGQQAHCLCSLSLGLALLHRAPKGRRSTGGCAVLWALCWHDVVRSGAWPPFSYVLWSHFALGNWGEALAFGDTSTVQEWVS